VDVQKAQSKGKTGKADLAISTIAKLYAEEKESRDSNAVPHITVLRKMWFILPIFGSRA
jgi:hypothetical protein